MTEFGFDEISGGTPVPYASDQGTVYFYDDDPERPGIKNVFEWDLANEPTLAQRVEDLLPLSIIASPVHQRGGNWIMFTGDDGAIVRDPKAQIEVLMDPPEGHWDPDSDDVIEMGLQLDDGSTIFGTEAGQLLLWDGQSSQLEVVRTQNEDPTATYRGGSVLAVRDLALLDDGRLVISTGRWHVDRHVSAVELIELTDLLG